MKVQKFRKKPVEIEAMQWTGDNSPAIASWSDLAFTRTDDQDREHTDDPEATASVYDRLHSTRVLVYTGDWIIKGISGEFYPCRPDVFAATYDEVTADAQPNRIHAPVTKGWTAVQVHPGGSMGHTIHASKRAAEKDARRLAKQSPNVEVWVCPVIDGNIVWNSDVKMRGL